MKVKSYGGSQTQSSAQQNKNQAQSSVLTSMASNNAAPTQSTSIYLLSSSHSQNQKDNNMVKSPYKMTPSTTATMKQHAATASKAQSIQAQQQAVVNPFSTAASPMLHPSQQLQSMTVAASNASDQQQQQQLQGTPGLKNTSVKTVNLSFTGTDFAHRNMSTSVHNGFYVNHHTTQQGTNVNNNNMMIAEDRKQAAGKQTQAVSNDHRNAAAMPQHHHFPPGNATNTQNQSQFAQNFAANNTGSLRSLGVTRQPQVGAAAASTGPQSFNTTAPGVFTTLHMPLGSNTVLSTPGQKKTVSSKNQQRRKISATINQSTQFQASANNMLLQGQQNNYPHSMKKKSSKAKMLLPDHSGHSGAQMMVPILQGGTQQNQQLMVGRAQSIKLQSSGLKQNRLPDQEESENFFIQDNRMVNTMSVRGYQQTSENIFATTSQINDGYHPQTASYYGQGYAISKQQLQSNIQTPNGSSSYKQSAVGGSSAGDHFSFPPQSTNSSGGQASLRTKTIGNNTQNLQQMVLIQPTSKINCQSQSHSQTQSQQLQLFQVQGQAKLNKNYLKSNEIQHAHSIRTQACPTIITQGSKALSNIALPSTTASNAINQSESSQSSAQKVPIQFEISPGPIPITNGKTQQRSYQSLQGQPLQMLNHAGIAIQTQATSPQPQHSIAPGPTNQHQQQTGFVYARKLVSMKPGSGVTECTPQMPISVQSPDSQFSNNSGQKHQITNGQRISMPAIYDQQPQTAELQQSTAIMTLEPLQLQKISGSHQLNNKPLLINQAQIQFAAREMTQPATQTTIEQIATSQGPVFVQQQQTQPSQKNTSLIVRIDNSNAANHQIIKRKRLKDGSMPMQTSVYRNGTHSQQTGTSVQEPVVGYESEQLIANDNEGATLQRCTVYLESLPNGEFLSLPIYQKGYVEPPQDAANCASDLVSQQLMFVEAPTQANGLIPTGLRNGNNKIKEAMANSQQNFNSNLLPVGNAARNTTHITTESVIDPKNDTGVQFDIIQHQQSRNGEYMNKPNSAIVHTRAAMNMQPSQMPQQIGRPDSKQSNTGAHLIAMTSSAKRPEHEFGSRDPMIQMVDDEDNRLGHDKIEDHYQDLSEAVDENDSQLSDANHSHSNDEATNFQFNKSVDSDKLGSFSYRQGGQAGLKLVQQNSQLQVPPNSQPAQQQQRFIDSDADSEHSGAGHQRFSYNAGVSAATREANYSCHNLASDSETDGNFSDTGSCFGRGTTMREDGPGGPGDHHDIDGISEHSSDLADSESGPDGDPLNLKKIHKAAGEKPSKRKKKKVQDERAATTKKSKGVEKENPSKTTHKVKEKTTVAPSKKNFTEVKEKEYHGKSKSTSKGGDMKAAAKAASSSHAKDTKHSKTDKGDSSNKNNKGADTQTLKKKQKPHEETKGGAATDGDAISPQKKATKQNKPQKPSLAMHHCVPKNLEEQKQVFFESNCTVNPVFEYESYAATQKYIAQFKEPSEELLELAKRILNSFIEIYGSESNYEATEGEIVPREETLTMFQEYCEQLGLEDWLRVEFKADMVPRTSFTHDPKSQFSRINIRDPPYYPRGHIYGAIDHEIGTHALRKYNEKYQVWHQKRQKYELKYCQATEEGFACVNQLVRTSWLAELI